MLTRAQRRAGRIVLRVIEMHGGVLAGGGAMNEAGLIDRPTHDMDFFTNNLQADLIAISELATQALEEVGMQVSVMRSDKQFVKLLVDADRRNAFELDFGFDYFQWAPVMGSIGPRLSDQELAVNKVLAAFGRIVPRDLMDLKALDSRFEWSYLFEKAKEKDSGFNMEVLAQMIKMNVASKEWQGIGDAAQFQTFGEKLIREIIPRELEKETASIAESPSGVKIEQAPEDLEIEPHTSRTTPPVPPHKRGRFHI